MGFFEWYTLDSELRRESVIEGFKSFIWTERYSAYGDFQIIIKSTFPSRQLLVRDTYLAMNKSDYVMKIETVDDDTDDTGARMLTVTGKSFEALLTDRVAFNVVGDTTTNPSWVITAHPGDVIREVFNQVCVNGIISQQDNIPFYTIGTLIGSGNIPESKDIITVGLQPAYVYDIAKQIADQYALGFRLIRNGETGQVYFEVYTGNDLTTKQTLKPPVVFDPNMESFTKPRFLTSTANLKTVAYVYAQNGSAIVYAPTASPSDSGGDRRVLLVNSSNSDNAGPDLITALQQEGLQALAAQTLVYGFDGELPSAVPYVYGKDYKLGDLVEEHNSDGNGNQMIVTEQIFSSDESGERAFPTLTLYSTVTPGSWRAIPSTQHWADYPTTTHWADL